MSELVPGVYPASISPFNEKGELDLIGLAHLVSWFRAAGCAGILVAGTNGEGPSLSGVEKLNLVRSALPLAEGQPIVLGVATSSIDEAVWLCESARKAGATAGLVMPPFFYRDVLGDQISTWYDELFRRTSLPILLYNFPQRSGIAITSEIIASLLRHDHFIGLKDSSGDRANLKSFADVASGKLLYVGDETLIPDALDAGWSGTMSGAANVMPKWLSAVVADWSADRDSALTRFGVIEPIIRELRRLPQPSANKIFLKRLHVIDDASVRTPLKDASEESVESAWNTLQQFVR